MIYSNILRGLAVAGLIGCGADLASAQQIAPKSDAPITITFDDYNLATAGIGADATKQLISEFMAANPTIKVVGVPVTSDQMTSRVQADIVAGRPPDVAQMVFNDLDFIVHNLGVKPLNKIIPADEWSSETAGIFPAGLQLGAMDGNIYGLAFTFSTPILYYNADLFKAAGLDPDQPPKNWDEVKKAALAIHAKTNQHGIYPAVFGTFDWVYQALVLSNGGRVLSEDRKKLMFAEPAALEALQTIRDLYASGLGSFKTDADAADAMGAGTLGMMLDTSVYQSTLLKASAGKFELREAAMPSFGDKPTQPTNSGSALFIFSNDPAKQRAAWEFLKFMTSKHAYTVITSQIGYLPLRLDIVDDPQYLGPWIQKYPFVRPNLEQLTRLQPWQSMPGPNYKQITNIETHAIEEAVLGDGDVAKVMTDAQQRATALMPK